MFSLRRTSRRDLLRITCASLALKLTAGTASSAASQEKITQQAAQYQDSPKDIRMCATCTLFAPPHSCNAVAGEVSPSGWCKLFVLAD